jgi:hypothetical protein
MILLLLASVLASCNHPSEDEQVRAAIEDQGLVGDYLGDETVSFIKDIAEDPVEVAGQLALGALHLLVVLFDEDTTWEHRAELLGPLALPFWDCARPVFGESIVDFSDIDFSLLDGEACGQEIVAGFFTGAVGHLLGKLIRRADGMLEHVDLSIDVEDAKRFTNRAESMVQFSSNIYQLGATRELPLALQSNRLSRPALYRDFAHPAFFTRDTTTTVDFDLPRFLAATRNHRTPMFDPEWARRLIERRQDGATTAPVPDIPDGFQPCAAQARPELAKGYTINSNGDGFLMIRELPSSTSSGLGSIDEGTTEVLFNQCAQTNPNDRWWHLEDGRGWMSARWLLEPS